MNSSSHPVLTALAIDVVSGFLRGTGTSAIVVYSLP
jgi:hypothetical protein